MKSSRNRGRAPGHTAGVATAPNTGSAPHAGTTRGPTVAVLLAAGAGSRFDGDGHKLLAEIVDRETGRTRSVVECSISNALAADLGPVVVVTGSAGDVVPDHLSGAVITAHNHRWAEGQITSLHCGIDAARSLGATAVVAGLADQPFIDPRAWRLVADCPAPIAVATYDGRRANPVKLTSDVWELLPTSGDEGARSLMRVRPELVREVACVGSPADIDTTEDLRRWQSN